MRLAHPQLLQAHRSFLFICDVQEKLWPQIDPIFQADMLRTIPVLQALAQELDLPVFVTEQYPKGLGTTLQPIAERLEGAQVFEKIHFSAMEDEIFCEALESSGRTQAVVCGMESHICVYQSVLGLLKLGYDVHVVHDALGSRTEDNHDIGLGLMSDAGARITSMETVMFQWLEKAGTKAFKAMQKLIV